MTVFIVLVPRVFRCIGCWSVPFGQDQNTLKLGCMKLEQKRQDQRLTIQDDLQFLWKKVVIKTRRERKNVTKKTMKDGNNIKSVK